MTTLEQVLAIAAPVLLAVVLVWIMARLVSEKVRDSKLTATPINVFSVLHFGKDHIVLKHESEFSSIMKFRMFYYIIKTRSLWKRLKTSAQSAVKRICNIPAAIR